MKFLIINGPNLNMLGLREPGIYGDRNYATLCELCQGWCAEEGIECELFQSNHEGVIVDKIQAAYGQVDGIVINPAAYTHTSVAISKVSDREAFRQVSFVSYYALKTIQGLGFEGYGEAIRWLKAHIVHMAE